MACAPYKLTKIEGSEAGSLPFFFVKQFYSVKSLALHLEVHPDTVRRWIKKLSLPVHKIGGIDRIYWKDFLEWAKAFRVDPRGELDRRADQIVREVMK